MKLPESKSMKIIFTSRQRKPRKKLYLMFKEVLINGKCNLNKASQMLTELFKKLRKIWKKLKKFN